MNNNGLFCSLYLKELQDKVRIDDMAQGRMDALTQAWYGYKAVDGNRLWDAFIKVALNYLEFVPSSQDSNLGIYSLYEDWGYNHCIGVLCLVPEDQSIGDTFVGRFHPVRLLSDLERRDLTWGILTDGALWRLYSTKSTRPYEDYVELNLAETLENGNEPEYCLFEYFFHRDSFVTKTEGKKPEDKDGKPRKCRLDHDRVGSEEMMVSLAP